MKSKRISLFTLVFSLVFILSSCGSLGVKQIDENKEASVETTAETTTEEVTTIETTTMTTTAPEPVVKEVKLSFVGDILPHIPVLWKQDKGDEFDFEPCFKYVNGIIADADYAVCNLETTLSGKDGGRNWGDMYKGYCGYPTFNSPESLAGDLKAAGFDMCLNANNHSLDGDMSGMFNTIDEVEKAGLDHTGTRKNKDEKNYIIKEINGMRVAFINYTYAMNGFMPSEEDDYSINHLGNYDEARIDAMIENISEMVNEGADVNIACVHIGVEYGLYPDDFYQKRIMDRMLDTGIDIIIGDHSHTLQPFEVLERNGEQKIIAYSMGNFLSNQMFYRLNRPTDFGGIVSIDIEQVDDGKPVFKEFSFTPTYCFVTEDNYYMVPIFDVPEDAPINDYDLGRMSIFNTEVFPRLTSMMKEEGAIDGEKIKWVLQ